MFEPGSVFGSHVCKLYSIANLEVARHDYTFCAHLDIIDPEHSFQLCSYIQREHHLYVKTVQAANSATMFPKSAKPKTNEFSSRWHVNNPETSEKLDCPLPVQ